MMHGEVLTVNQVKNDHLEQQQHHLHTVSRIKSICITALVIVLLCEVAVLSLAPVNGAAAITVFCLTDEQPCNECSDPLCKLKYQRNTIQSP